MDFAVCAPEAGPVRTEAGFGITVEHDLSRAAEADLIAVPARPGDLGVPESVLETLRAGHARGARILSLCTGAFVLGEAGLLDGRSCTTHWRHSADLAAAFPLAHVVPEVLYVDDDRVLTSAGTAAGIDACLYLWRQEFGAAAASTVARRMVVPPQVWMTGHLKEQHTVDTLARSANMSPRTFARRFRAETGTTPHAWITSQRVLRAEELLETNIVSAISSVVSSSAR